MKVQLAARELELDKKHIELLQMSDAEAKARASTASALEQVLRMHAHILAKSENIIYCFCLRGMRLIHTQMHARSTRMHTHTCALVYNISI